jgi:hypothetical protein
MATVTRKWRVSPGFGRCSRCFFISVIATLLSTVPVVVCMFVDLSRMPTWIGVVPLALSAAWLALHIAGYLRHRSRPLFNHERWSATAHAERVVPAGNRAVADPARTGSERAA